ncbi:MAG: hypothetical protein WAM82_32750 [Thermoanaerobaculia bacterium]
MNSQEATAVMSRVYEKEEEDEKAFEDYYKNVYGKRKIEWLKSVAEKRERRTLELAESFRPQTR